MQWLLRSLIVSADQTKGQLNYGVVGFRNNKQLKINGLLDGVDVSLQWKCRVCFEHEDINHQVSIKGC
jgi:hypothetical protein